MTVREYLEQPETLRLEIRRKQARIETLRRLSTRFSAQLSDVRVQSSPDPARMQAFLAEAADEEREVRRLEAERVRALADAALLISALPDDRMARVMELRYLDRCRWEEIADRLECSGSAVFRLHRRALELLPSPPGTPAEQR